MHHYLLVVEIEKVWNESTKCKETDEAKEGHTFYYC